MDSAAENPDCSLVYTFMPDSTTAEDLAEALILAELAAAVSLVPEVKTYKASRKYGIKDKPEIMMIIKTRTSKVTHVTDYIKLNCPYNDDKVDVTSVKIENGNEAYLKWVYDNST